jgi:glycosyltransferase involved in cell wall biosynthesis
MPAKMAAFLLARRHRRHILCPMRNMLFFRDYRSFQGGHLKLADYIAHTQASALFTPRLFLSANSLPDHPFPRDCLTNIWQPEQADALFLAGMDWAQVPLGLESRIPTINLLQGLVHADPANPRYAFLSRPAIRLCVSAEVAQAVQATGRANGPVHTISAGLDLSAIPQGLAKTARIFIGGMKDPALAEAIAAILRQQGVEPLVQISPLTRADSLALMASARIAITLPLTQEGFFLPALEAMAAGCATICPDAHGNRAFCRHGQTCLKPERNPTAIASAALTLLEHPALADTLARNGQAEAQSRSLSAERSAYLAILRSLT